MTLSQLVLSWLPDFHIADHRLAGERAELIQERAIRSTRHQAVRDVDHRLRQVTNRLLKRQARARA